MPLREYRCVCGSTFTVLKRQADPEQASCPECGEGLYPVPSTFSTKNTAIRSSERPIVFRNPQTGEMRFPASREQPLDPKFAAAGFVREEAFTTFGERDAFEKATGRIHEQSHYDSGSATAERDLVGPDPEVRAREILANMKKEHPIV